MILVWVGATLLAVGLALYLFLKILLKPYQGCSGAGMSGLPAAFLLVIAYAFIGLGVLMLLVSLIV